MAVGRRFLADKSAWVQQVYSEDARSRIDALRTAKRLYLCAVTMAEMLYSATGADERRADHELLGRLGSMRIDSKAEEHLAEIMTALPIAGPNCAPGLPGLFVAAVARANGATVLHYDKDFELIADTSGLSHEWIIPRGTGHGRH